MTNLSNVIVTAYAALLRALDHVRWLALLLARLAVGLLFMSTGWGKVHNLVKVAGFFEHLGIPAPAFNAALVGYSELICGTLLVVGLLTRFATVPLAISMIVAICTAKGSEIHGPFDLVGADEFTYLVVLIVIAVLGPGSVALDHFVARRLPRSSS
ncbi:MAG TPA: DoxX family protein [Polyangiaceae bacterium]|nr:DoxX family protein [Polyangiaceae bacterium]